jgi:hypothetical protein
MSSVMLLWLKQVIVMLKQTMMMMRKGVEMVLMAEKQS